jgi:hypothetical protein
MLSWSRGFPGLESLPGWFDGKGTDGAILPGMFADGADEVGLLAGVEVIGFGEVLDLTGRLKTASDG